MVTLGSCYLSMFILLVYVTVLIQAEASLRHSASFDWILGNTSVALAAAAYCPYDEYLTRVYKDHANGFECKFRFLDEANDMQGYIGVMESQRSLFVVFRGSKSVQNWIDDLDIAMADYPYCNGCQVHDGFYSAEKAVADEIVQDLKTLVTTYPDYTVVVTGHSLGAAVATLFTMDLLKKYSITNVKLMNFGSPRVGNQKWAEYASSEILHRSRVTHYKDMVPHCPLHERFTHISGEWYEDSTGLKECVGYEDESCAYQWTMTSITDHFYYLGQYIACDDEEHIESIPVTNTL